MFNIIWIHTEWPLSTSTSQHSNRILHGFTDASVKERPLHLRNFDLGQDMTGYGGGSCPENLRFQDVLRPCAPAWWPMCLRMVWYWVFLKSIIVVHQFPPAPLAHWCRPWRANTKVGQWDTAIVDPKRLWQRWHLWKPVTNKHFLSTGSETHTKTSVVKPFFSNSWPQYHKLQANCLVLYPSDGMRFILRKHLMSENVGDVQD